MITLFRYQKESHRREICLLLSPTSEGKTISNWLKLQGVYFVWTLGGTAQWFDNELNEAYYQRAHLHWRSSSRSQTTIYWGCSVFGFPTLSRRLEIKGP